LTSWCSLAALISGQVTTTDEHDQDSRISEQIISLARIKEMAHPYAALAANTSTLRALVIKQTLSAKAAVKPPSMPSRGSGS
jgi:hypothetical protein